MALDCEKINNNYKRSIKRIKTGKVNEFITNPEDCESIYIEALKRGNKDLVEENQRLKAQLNKEIHYNRIMKRALEKYADNMNWCVDRYSNKYKKWARCEDGFKLAKQILKEIDNKE